MARKPSLWLLCLSLAASPAAGANARLASSAADAARLAPSVAPPLSPENAALAETAGRILAGEEPGHVPQDVVNRLALGLESNAERLAAWGEDPSRIGVPVEAALTADLFTAMLADAQVWDRAQVLLRTVRGTDRSEGGLEDWPRILRNLSGEQREAFLGETASIGRTAKQALGGDPAALGRLYERTARSGDAPSLVDASGSPSGTGTERAAALAAQGLPGLVQGEDIDGILESLHARYSGAVRVFSQDSMAFLARFSADGKLAVSRSNDTVAIWDVATGKEIRSIRDGMLQLRSAALSPDGRLLLTGTWDGALNLWDVADEPGGKIGSFDRKEDIYAIAWSPDGKSALLGGARGTVALWDVAEGKEIRSFAGHVKPVFYTAFAAGGRLVSKDGTGTVRVWDRASGAQLRVFQNSKSAVVSPDGRSILSSDGKLADLTTGEERRAFKNPKGADAVALSPDMTFALSADRDGQIKLWSMAEGKEVGGFRYIPGGTVLSLAFSPDGKSALAGHWRGEIALIDLAHRVSKDGARGQVSSLAKLLPRMSQKQTQAFAQVIQAKDSPAMRKAIWGPLRDYIAGPGPAEAPLTPRWRRWTPGQEERVKARMPTLHRILHDPAALERFLSVLSFLREVYPYDLAKGSKLPPIAWARRRGVQFQLGELHIVPVSDSFRRHVIYVSDAGGLFAVDFMIPGELEDRHALSSLRFTLARQMWEESPEEPGVVRPLYIGRFKGSARMYGMDLDFTGRESLTVLMFEYEEGKRLEWAGKLISAIARQNHTTARDVLRGVLADLAVPAVRLHRMGWRGNTPAGSDMHAGNAKVLVSGRGVMAADFGIFERHPLSMAQRAAETLRLLDHPDLSQRQEIYPLVVERLTRFRDQDRPRREVEEEVRAELELGP